MGPRAWRINRAGRSGSSARARELERRWCAAVADFLDVRFDIEGLEHVDRHQQYVVAALHEGFADALALMRLGLDLRFVARDELLEWPTLGRYLRSSGQILIDPTRGRSSYRRMVNAGRLAVAAGESVVVCPQGSILGVETAFWPGTFALAERLGVPLLPVVVTGSHRVWEYPYTPVVGFGQRMSMRVLEPVSPKDAVTGASALERTMKRIALQPGMAPARRFQPEVDGYWDDYPYEIDPAFPELADAITRHREAGSR